MSKDCCQTGDINLHKKENTTLKRIFWVVLLINSTMFIVEVVSGILAHSNALTADAMDMFSDAFIYGLSLFVLTKSITAKAWAALVNGVSMLILGLFVVAQIVYKILNPTLPNADTITVIGIIALVANVICFSLLYRHRNDGLNIKSAWVCSRNDIFGNTGVILAGILVAYFNSMWPDIIIGSAIAVLVLYSCYDIIQEALVEIRNNKAVSV